MATDAIAAAMAAAGQEPAGPAAEQARVANAFDSAVLAARQDGGLAAPAVLHLPGGQLTEGLRILHGDSQRMSDLLGRMADRGAEAAGGWNYQALQVGGPQATLAGDRAASTADLMQLYQMTTRTQLLSKVCNMVPDVCTSIIKAT